MWSPKGPLPQPEALLGETGKRRSDVEAEVHHVAIAHDVVFAFDGELARFAALGFAAERLNKVQFLTIRAYLTLVFGALVVLLMVLAVWH